jgi:hypothetical protein
LLSDAIAPAAITGAAANATTSPLRFTLEVVALALILAALFGTFFLRPIVSARNGALAGNIYSRKRG